MGKLEFRRLDDIFDGETEKYRVYNAMLDFASVSCDSAGGHARFTVGYTDADGDSGSLFNGLDFDGLLADFIVGFTSMICRGLMDDDEEIYLEDMPKTPARIVMRDCHVIAIGHFLDDKFIKESDVVEWLKNGGTR